MDLTKREIPIELLGNTALDPYYGSVSAARGAMFVSQIGQSPVVEKSEPRRIMTGMEMRYAEHTFDVRFPVDCTLLRVIRKYPAGYGNDAIKATPVTTLFYESYYDEYKEVGIINVPDFISHHQEFGFPLKKDPNVWGNLAEGELFAKDTIIAKSTAVKDDGLYGMGVNANVAFMSLPGTIEDGMIFAREYLEEHFSPRTYTNAVIGAGKKAFLLNLYGDDTHYKPFPDIGERIREDGVIFAVRDLDDDLSPAEMTPRALREFDRTFDRGVIGSPGSIVKDIRVFRDDRQNPSFTPTGMDTQLRKYYDALSDYYSQVLKFYYNLKGKRKERLRITEEFYQLVVEALIYLPQDSRKRKLTRMYRLEQLDEWRVELTYETKRIPGEAYKFSDFFGGLDCRSEFPSVY